MATLHRPKTRAQTSAEQLRLLHLPDACLASIMAYACNGLPWKERCGWRRGHGRLLLLVDPCMRHWSAPHFDPAASAFMAVHAVCGSGPGSIARTLAFALC